MRQLPLLCLLLVGCAASPDTASPRPVSRPPGVPFPDGMSEDVRGYLTTLYGQLQPWWYVALKKAQQSFSSDHCVNDRSLEADVEVQLDDADRPAKQALQRASGCKLFDETALSVLQWMQKIPPRPKSLAGEGRLRLRWRFFRDKRGCEPAFARLELVPFSPEERISRALGRKDWIAARQALEEAGRSPAVLAVLARVGLGSEEPAVRRAALGVASTEQVMAMLLKDRTAAMWAAGVRVLEARRAEGTLAGLLKELARLARGSDAPRIEQLLQALGRLRAPVPEVALDALLLHPAPAVLLAALDRVDGTQPLARARSALKKSPERMGALAARWCSLQEDAKAAQVVRWSLGGPGRTLTLEALLRHPVPGMVKDLEALVRAETPAPDRVLGIRVLSKIEAAPLASLRIALAAGPPEVKIAAARALGLAQRDRVASTYRLTAVAKSSRGEVAAACFAAQAMLGYEPFRRELLRLTRRLPEGQRAEVVASLWGYGEAAVPDLVRIARGAKGPLLEAVHASLRKIPGDAARKALDELPPPTPEPTPPSGPPPGPLEQLRLLAAER